MTYHSGAEMGMDDYMLDSQMMEGYDMFIPEGPFFSYIITYSGHGPYTEEMGNISAPTGKPPRQRWPSPAWNPPRPIWKSTPTPWPTPWRRTSSSASWWPSWRLTAA